MAPTSHVLKPTVLDSLLKATIEFLPPMCSCNAYRAGLRLQGGAILVPNGNQAPGQEGAPDLQDLWHVQRGQRRVAPTSGVCRFGVSTACALSVEVGNARNLEHLMQQIFATSTVCTQEVISCSEGEGIETFVVMPNGMTFLFMRPCSPV